MPLLLPLRNNIEFPGAPTYEDAPEHRYRYLPVEVRAMESTGDARPMESDLESVAVTAPEDPRRMTGGPDSRAMLAEPEDRRVIS